MYQDAQGALYVHEEIANHVAEKKKAPVWPWVLAGAAVVAGAALWMSQSPPFTRNSNPTDTDIFKKEAEDPQTSWERLENLCHHSDPSVLQSLVHNPSICKFDEKGNINTYLLKILAKKIPDEVIHSTWVGLFAFMEQNESMLEVVAQCAESTEDMNTIRSIYNVYGRHLEIAFYVAENNFTPIDILEETSSHEAWQIRSATARNKGRLALDTIVRLLSDQDLDIRYYAELKLEEEIRHGTVSTTDLFQLSNYQSTNVRMAVARCNETPIEVLMHMHQIEKDKIVLSFIKNSISSRK